MKQARRYTQGMALLGGLAMTLWCGCIRDELEPCPPLGIQLEVEDKNYLNVKAANRLGFEEIRSEDLPFASYVSSLIYRLTDAKSGQVIVEQPLTLVTGEQQTVTVPVPEDIPFGRYVLTAWGNLPADGKEALGDDFTRLALHPDSQPGADVYLASDTLDYNETDYAYTLGMKRVKGKLIVAVEDMPDAFRYSEKEISDIRGQVDSRFTYSAPPRSFRLATVWPQPEHIVTKTLLAPSTGAAESLFKIRFYVGDNSEDDNWIAPEDVSITMSRNELTVLRYVYDPCCCRFKIYILVNDNWELLHSMEID